MAENKSPDEVAATIDEVAATIDEVAAIINEAIKSVFNEIPPSGIIIIL